MTFTDICYHFLPRIRISSKHYLQIAISFNSPLGDLNWILWKKDWSQFLWLMVEVPLVKLPADECYYLLDLTDDYSALIQVMAWSHQVTSHYRSQCWPRSMSPYGISKLQWVKCNWKPCGKYLYLYCFNGRKCDWLHPISAERKLSISPWLLLILFIYLLIL